LEEIIEAYIVNDDEDEEDLQNQFIEKAQIGSAPVTQPGAEENKSSDKP
jgi:hypothetical protein